ncbi:MAG TPA: hypothetical protein VFC92_11935 [Bacteroidales bacterium]|nr:hypothetical protein [Bacteroidales bacterium]
MRKIALLFLLLVSLSSFAQADRNEITTQKARFLQTASPDTTTDIRYQRKGKAFVEAGYDFGANFGQLKLNMVFGLQVSPQFYWGMGAGVRLVMDEPNLVPVFLNFKYNLTDGVAPAFVAIDAGFTLAFDKLGYGGGWMLDPRFGIRIKANESLAVDLSVGFEYQRGNLYAGHYFHGVGIHAGLFF